MEKTKVEAINLLKEGKIGIFPTDTAYGMGCRMDIKESIQKIYSLRNRPKEKALLILASSFEMAKRYVDIEEKNEEILKKYWPGGLTAILPCKKEMVLDSVRAGGDTLAVRIPDSNDLQEIIEQVGVPIVAPSANYSGEKTPLKLSDVDTTLVSKVDFLMNGVCTMEGVSTIVDATVLPWKIIRQGVVKL